MQIALLLHYYNGQEFMVQKMQQFDLATITELGWLIALLSVAVKPQNLYYKTDYVTESDDFKHLCLALEHVYDRSYFYNPIFKDLNLESATNVRVMQIIALDPVSQQELQKWPLFDQYC